jgi:hemerythrin
MVMLWEPEMSVGVPVIDQQHQELFRRVNALLVAMHRGWATLETERLLGFLASYAMEHFRDEELLMEHHRYPGAALHRQQHAAFAGRIEELRAKLAAEGSSCDLSIAVNRTVCGWLREHTSRADVALAKHLRAVTAAEPAGLRRAGATGR